MKGYIYQIINKVDGRRYVGQTINLQKRKNTHFSQLRKGTHPNDLLQKAWDDWGEESFSFVYEEYEIEDSNFLNNKEIEYIKKHNSYLDGYNRTPGGQGGAFNRKLSFEDFCLVYFGCQWKGMSEKIGKYLNIDSSVISSILREKGYPEYFLKIKTISQKEIDNYKILFRQIFNINENKLPDENRVPYHLTQEEYFYCFCIASTYGRGIEAALAKYFNKHKSFLFNGLKGKTKGKVFNAHQKFLLLSPQEANIIGENKFLEWKIDKYSKNKIFKNPNDKWRN